MFCGPAVRTAVRSTARSTGGEKQLIVLPFFKLLRPLLFCCVGRNTMRVLQYGGRLPSSSRTRDCRFPPEQLIYGSSGTAAMRVA